jgi:hypothetical protein
MERWFAQVISNGSGRETFGSVLELERTIHSYIRGNNHERQLFVWTATAAAI